MRSSRVLNKDLQVSPNLVNTCLILALLIPLKHLKGFRSKEAL